MNLQPELYTEKTSKYIKLPI